MASFVSSTRDTGWRASMRMHPTFTRLITSSPMCVASSMLACIQQSPGENFLHACLVTAASSCIGFPERTSTYLGAGRRARSGSCAAEGQLQSSGALESAVHAKRRPRMRKLGVLRWSRSGNKLKRRSSERMLRLQGVVSLIKEGCYRRALSALYPAPGSTRRRSGAFEPRRRRGKACGRVQRLTPTDTSCTARVSELTPAFHTQTPETSCGALTWPGAARPGARGAPRNAGGYAA